MSQKRKRSELDSSDEEEPTLGKQVLPVANLPADFDGVPQDGLQYLFTVRCVQLSHTTTLYELTTTSQEGCQAFTARHTRHQPI